MIQKPYGYLSTCLIFSKDRKQHCIISSNYTDSYIPQCVLKFMDPNYNLPSYFEGHRKKLMINFSAIESNHKKVDLEFGFSISKTIKYPILGADFLQSKHFKSLEKHCIILNVKGLSYEIPIYLSTAINRYRPSNYKYYKEAIEETSNGKLRPTTRIRSQHMNQTCKFSIGLSNLSLYLTFPLSILTYPSL